MLPFDTSVPNVARMYDYVLGGKDNYQVDRDAAEKLLKIAPDASQAAADNRKFLGHAVRFLAREPGIRQFIDIGSGLPSMGNVHEVAQEVDQGCRVAYVDYDVVVISHARALLATDDRVVAVQGDLRAPQAILQDPDLVNVIDLGRPVGVTLVAILHFLEDDAAYGAVEYLKEAVAPGSYLAISHGTPDGAREGETEEVTGIYEHASARLYPRTQEQISRFLDGLELVRPGVVPAGDWRSKTPARRVICYGAVGRKPQP